MEKSHNTLVIDAIETETGHDFQLAYCKATLKAHIDINCSVNGNLFRRVNLVSAGKRSSDREATRMAIEGFMFGFFISNTDYFDVDTMSFAHGGIDHVQYDHLPEPYKSLFKDLFEFERTDIMFKDKIM